MIRVGFILPEWELEWLGGLNYYRNLLSAIAVLDNCDIRAVVFTGSSSFDHIHGVEVVKVRWLRSSAFTEDLWKLLKRFRRIQGHVLGVLLRLYRIDVLSHFGPLRTGRRIRNIGWIPDFQHMHLPNFFSSREAASRNRKFREICRECDHIVVSSNSTQKDLLDFYPEASGKVSVLRFVPEIKFPFHKEIRELEEKYEFRAPFFFLPNQFWIHKNHRIVIEAIGILREWGMNATVVATGKTQDYRDKGHYSNLMLLVDQLGLAEYFRVLGVVPYGDLLELMRHSIAVINPSLFEGWSTTVEEAIALRKRMILSDIPVHREQGPDLASYFEATNSTSLAQQMRKCFLDFSETPRYQLGAADMLRHSKRRMAFGIAYVNVVRTLSCNTAQPTLAVSQKD